MVRVSSANQAADDRNGIPRQLATTRQYCAAQLSAAIRRGVTFEAKRYVIERLDVRARTRVLDDGRRVLDVLLTLPGVEQSRAVIVFRDIHIAAHSDRRPALAITLPLPPPGPHARNAAGRFTPTPRPSPETKRAPRRGR